jgi:rhodanese-related sulfurtransferase
MVKIEVLGSSHNNFAGNVTPQTTWNTLNSDQSAQLIDVRTSAEWTFVGKPDLTSANKQLICIAWQSFPNMQIDSAFTDRVSENLSEQGLSKNTPVFFLCRSGARSALAAQALTATGWNCAYNVAAGFEGDKNQDGHRGMVNGWKRDGLPWTQT